MKTIIKAALIFVIMAFGQAQSIVDFTYSEYLKDSRINSDHNSEIAVSPYKQVFKDY